MSLNLPEPSPTGDVWGNQLNDAISGLVQIAVDAAVAAGGIALGDYVKFSNPGRGNITPISQLVGTSEFWLAAAGGLKNGLATLDDAAQLPLNQAGNISYATVGAAAAKHTHPVADIPDVARALDAAPAIAIFNTTTNTWPARVTLTTSLTRTVIWFGDADLPTDARAGIDLFFGPDNRGGGTVPNPGSDPGNGTTTPDPGTGNVTGAPTVTVNGSEFNLAATFTNGTTATTYAYLQLAVRGPNGESLDTGYLTNVTLAANAAQALSGSGTATSTGTWSAWIAYNVTGGADQVNWVDGPKTTFAISSLGGGVTPPPAGDPGGSRTIPLLGRSGLGWNSGVFYDAGSITAATNFAKWRGRKLDSIMYFPGRGSDNDLNYRINQLDSWAGYRIFSVPCQPDKTGNLGTSTTYTNFWKQWGTDAKAQGWNDGRTIVRLNWEGNGNWYAWAWVNGGSALFVQTYMNVVNAIRSTAPKMLFDFTMNRNNNYTGQDWRTAIADPLINHYDIIGLDSYDDFPGAPNLSLWNQQIAQNPGPTSIADYCRTKGKMMWFQEWSSSHRPDGSPGNDNPFYITQMWTWMNANIDILAGETYYEDNGTNSQNGTLYSSSFNPNAGAAYRALTRWGGTGTTTA
jgi:hypothetical protein